MNRERTAAAAAIMLAYAEGKTIQTRRWIKNGESIRTRDDQVWVDVNPNSEPLWCWHTHEFRVKPRAVMSRRFLYRAGDGVEVGVVSNKFAVDSPCQTFIRWVDPDWVEHEL